jgi:hypothetical protein
LVLTTPKGWAREHPEKFTGFTFIEKDVPKTPSIAKKMAEKFGFKRETTSELIVLYKFEE